MTTIRTFFLFACTIVFSDFFPILPNLAPQGMPNWRQEVQVSTCAEAPTSWNPIQQCRVFVSSRLIDAEDRPLSSTHTDGWSVVAQAPCQEVSPLEPKAPDEATPTCTSESCSGT
jgi:hypothetical protein